MIITSLFLVNANECLMTRMQQMSLDYHFKVEQEVGSSAYAFFGFNGSNLILCLQQFHQFSFSKRIRILEVVLTTMEVIVVQFSCGHILNCDYSHNCSKL